MLSVLSLVLFEQETHTTSEVPLSYHFLLPPTMDNGGDWRDNAILVERQHHYHERPSRRMRLHEHNTTEELEAVKWWLSKRKPQAQLACHAMPSLSCSQGSVDSRPLLGCLPRPLATPHSPTPSDAARRSLVPSSPATMLCRGFGPAASRTGDKR